MPLIGRGFSLGCVALAALAGCTTMAEPSRPPILAGTQWVLIDYKGAADAAATEVPLNKYQMALDASGTASLTLDCNRATSSWSATEPKPNSGQLRFGNMASTMELCADGGVGERLAKELAPAAEYSLYDGRLTLKTNAGTQWTFDSIA